ncbi:uncharacterized protein LOC106078893 isoform X1 [Biomphalaria glabrata]|uniref:Uncharacterized protein LOC106078893 isoform X1 n=1 Tax=Biomphalaria glabrata TaxID=6526 RepID=A0A9W2Z789_BIOGL|nr:uncharacterized protein LOC106078893 isoform X1 [Biomphalaria glabrata]
MIKSNMIKAACAIALIAIIFNIVAILTPNWSENKVASSGLWKACAKTIPICGEYDYMADIKDRKVKIFATAAFAIIGLLCSLVGFAFSVMIVLENKSDYNSYKIVWGTLFAAGFCLILSILIWYVAVAESPGFSWFLELIAGVLHIISAGLHYYAYKNNY